MKIFRSIKVLMISAAAFSLTGCGGNHNIRKMEKELKKTMIANKAIGLAVVAVKDSSIFYQGYFGYNDLENKIPLKGDDLFRIASISKQFTATALMQQVEKGKINLNEDVSELVGFRVRNPKYPNDTITVRMLLSHTSSLNDKNGYFSLNVIDPDSTANWQNAYNDYRPGSRYEYCNLGFNMLGTILERVSGERFDKYIVNHILTPLGIYGGYDVNSLDSSKFVKLYHYNHRTCKFEYSPEAYAPRRREIADYKMGFSTPVFSPTGGMKISASGLAKIMIMHMNNGSEGNVRILSENSSRIMQSVQADSTESGDKYGLALEITGQVLPGKIMTGHTGSAYGVYSSFFFDPAEHFGFVVITNGIDERYENYFLTFHKDVDAVLYKYLIK
ncbi:MAG: beta-lactamase family protein [Bacteroidales bacterium]|jgi:CubicO group peptidase (beta-lactamase class C family)|nr:beta-lactamase family protein [Bacteroidales bacterium]